MTLGVYFLVFWWRATKQVDQHLVVGISGLQAPSHAGYRTSVWILIATAAITLVGAMVRISRNARHGDLTSPLEAIDPMGGILIAGAFLSFVLAALAQARALTSIATWRAPGVHPVPFWLLIPWSLATIIAALTGQAIPAAIGAAGLVAMVCLTQANLNAIWKSQLGGP